MISVTAFLALPLFCSFAASLPFTGNPNIFQCRYPGDSDTFSCSLNLPNFPRLINGAWANLYQFGAQSKASDSSKRILQLISDAADAVLPTYSALADLSNLMIDMYVVENFTPGRTEDGETK
jgi:hypothetical protein